MFGSNQCAYVGVSVLGKVNLKVSMGHFVTTTVASDQLGSFPTSREGLRMILRELFRFELTACDAILVS